MRWSGRKRAGGVALALSAVLVLAGCGGGAAASGDDAGGAQTLTVAARQDVSSFDTGQLDTGFQVQYWQPVYDTLLRYTPTGEIEPNMAEEFSYNDDNTVLTLSLREGITFSDGTPFDAAAVKANIEHLQAGTGVAVYMVGLVEEVVVVDDLTVEIRLSAPDPAFTYYLCLVAGAMASPAAFGTDSFATVPVGSGPYLLDADTTIRGSQYSYVRNPDYWNPDAYPYDKVVVKPMEDVTARLNALKSGQVNTADVDASVRTEAEAAGLTINEAQVTWLGLIVFDRAGQQVPALGDVRVRQALNHAVDGDAIVKNIFGGSGAASQQIFNPDSPAYVGALDDAYAYDPEKAKKLLAEAGYPDGFEITMPEVKGDLTQPYVTQQLADVGITVTWDKVSSENLVGDLLGGKYAIASFGSSSGHPWRDIFKMISPDGAWNPMHTTTPELEALLTEIQATTGDAQTAAYQAVNEYVTENAWFGVWVFTSVIQLTDAQTSTQMQLGSNVPYLASYAPAS
ncbi:MULTISPECIES: ABC transporter substrate-binding protein [Microbacterium]|uniref:ABC transporter substrate-binding protein n=1 Tax=Microbacterium TaxID=33882 RepID=UPI0030104C7F